ncbi:hypothetical protein EY643_17705 [Halioglobus maricola]|uniref:Uncharacterized protein n=1 Tax=Halioglobus maricola TaxID=2601894 RepID=A0A5P9NNV0_9GAMM|nr:hypothetical protein [Halioglobus maricola]QFU77349.1 hypothetical protein EY643_17705 [Halioglobus maricola]
MFFKGPDKAPTQVTFSKALRHLVVFQLKLGADALRDLLMSPLSILVFLIDAVRKPALEDSLYVQLMLLGRRSDRFINLFDEYEDKGHHTMDEAIESLEKLATDASSRDDSEKE